tara:strand:+ start:242 stop:505 length:264 start_codon:yes stop_codon:yes gene_type:complete
MKSMKDITKTFLGENKMTTRYLTTKEDNQRIIANIITKLDELYNTNRTLLEQNTLPAWEAVQENWKYMRELEARLVERKNPKIYKEC